MKVVRIGHQNVQIQEHGLYQEGSTLLEWRKGQEKGRTMKKGIWSKRGDSDELVQAPSWSGT